MPSCVVVCVVIQGIHYFLVGFTVCPPPNGKAQPCHTHGKPKRVTNVRIKYRPTSSSPKHRAYNVAWQEFVCSHSGQPDVFFSLPHSPSPWHSRWDGSDRGLTGCVAVGSK